MGVSVPIHSNPDDVIAAKGTMERFVNQVNIINVDIFHSITPLFINAK